MAEPWSDVREPRNMRMADYYTTPRDGIQDWWAIIQEAIDDLITKRTQSNQIDQATLYLPPGIYKISKPLVIRNPKLVLIGMAVAYGPCSIDLIGSSAGVTRDATFSHGTIIKPTFIDKPAIAIEGGASVRLEKLVIEGLNQWIDHSDPNRMETHLREVPSPYVIAREVRLNTMSPYAGICIDPFSEVVQGTNRYPDMLQFYEDPMPPIGVPKEIRGRGSSFLEISDCIISGFAVGIVISPAGNPKIGAGSQPANAENIRISNCTILSTRSAIAICQTQSRNVTIENLTVFGARYVLDCAGDGQMQGNFPAIFGANIRGIAYFMTGPFAGNCYSMNGLRIENFLGLGQAYGIGTTGIGESDAFVFNGCHFTFGRTPPQSVSAPAHFINGGSAVFNNCTFQFKEGAPREVEEALKFINEGTLSFNTCLFDLPELPAPPLWVVGTDENVCYQDCIVHERKSAGVTALTRWSAVQAIHDFTAPEYLRAQTLPGSFYYRSALGQPRWVSGPYPRVDLGAVNLTVPGDGSATFVLAKSIFSGLLRVGDLICTAGFVKDVLFPVGHIEEIEDTRSAQVVLGRVTEIRPTVPLLMEIVLTYVPRAVKSGSLSIYATYFPRIHPATRGIVVKGQSVISGVRSTEVANVQDGWAVGDRIRGAGIEPGTYITKFTDDGMMPPNIGIILSRRATMTVEDARLFDADVHAINMSPQK